MPTRTKCPSCGTGIRVDAYVRKEAPKAKKPASKKSSKKK